MLYRVMAIAGSALALAACTSSSDLGDFSKFGNMDVFKAAPVMDTVRFESEPPGAEAKVSSGQTCRTPCALALPTEQPLTVTYTLAGFEAQAQQIEVVASPGEVPHLRPNPVVAELAAMAPPKIVKKKKSVRRPAAKRKPARKPAAAAVPRPTAAAPAAAPAPAPAAVPTFAPPPPASSSPWPAPPPQQK